MITLLYLKSIWDGNCCRLLTHDGGRPRCRCLLENEVSVFQLLPEADAPPHCAGPGEGGQLPSGRPGGPALFPQHLCLGPTPSSPGHRGVPQAQGHTGHHHRVIRGRGPCTGHTALIPPCKPQRLGSLTFHPTEDTLAPSWSPGLPRPLHGWLLKPAKA